MIKIIMCTIVLLLSMEIFGENLRIELTENNVSQDEMYTIGTFLKVGTCTRFVFENSIMLVCREQRRVFYDLYFRGWFDIFEDDFDKLWLKMFLNEQIKVRSTR